MKTLFINFKNVNNFNTVSWNHDSISYCATAGNPDRLTSLCGLYKDYTKYKN